MNRCHVHADCRAEKLGRELFVVLIGVVHSLGVFMEDDFAIKRTRQDRSRAVIGTEIAVALRTVGPSFSRLFVQSADSFAAMRLRSRLGALDGHMDKSDRPKKAL